MDRSWIQTLAIALLLVAGVSSTGWAHQPVMDMAPRWESRITLAMRPGEKIPLRDIYQRIKKAGYDPITLYVRSEGTLERSGEKLLLRDSKSGQVFSIVGGEIAGVADNATVNVQAQLVASQLPDRSRVPSRPCPGVASHPRPSRFRALPQRASEQDCNRPCRSFLF